MGKQHRNTSPVTALRSCLAHCLQLGQAMQITSRDLSLVCKRKGNPLDCPTFKLQAHCYHTRLPFCTRGSWQHCAPAPLRPRAMCEAAPIPKFSADVYRKDQYSALLHREKTQQTYKTLIKTPGFPKSPVLKSKTAWQFSSALKQEVALLPQQPAESLGFESLLKYTVLSL